MSFNKPRLKLPKSIQWEKKQGELNVILLNQEVLPNVVDYIECKTHKDITDAILTLAVRGAPAIGCAGSAALALWAFNEAPKDIENEELLSLANKVAKTISNTRPTAVNLTWAVERSMEELKENINKNFDNAYGLGASSINSIDSDELLNVIKESLLNTLETLLEEDAEQHIKIGENGLALFDKPLGMMTICNAGSIATAYYGTALGVAYSAYEMDLLKKVWVLETRPKNQGARLTTWELNEVGVPFTLIVDSAAASVMAKGDVQIIIVGADRVAANGDTANKIGTNMLAILANYYGIDFYVAAPLSSFDLTLESGQSIEIEERSSLEIEGISVKMGDSIEFIRQVPEDIDIYNPAFDVTKNDLIKGFITEKGIIYPDQNGNYDFEHI